MKPRSRQRHKGRQDSGTFTRIPHAIQEAPNWRLLGHVAVHLLLDLARQYNGRNNGDLCAALSVLSRFGWKSNDTVGTALRELLHYGFIVLTRQGGLHAPNLYALTWHPIDDCGGKLDVSPSRVASGEWKQVRTKFKRPAKKRNATPPAGAQLHRQPVHRAA